MNYDAIIIGAGLGGLMAGAQLSKKGKKVLILEQHYLAGGAATTFSRKGFRVEVGLHELDGLDNKGEGVHSLLNSIGALDELEFVRVPEFYRFTNSRHDIVVPDNVDEAIEVLSKHFPNEKAGIQKYFDKLLGIRNDLRTMPSKGWKKLLMPITHKHLVTSMRQTMGDFMDSIIKDDELKLVLAANMGYYHDNAYTMALSFYGVAQASYYTGGGFFIKGGSQNLSDYMVRYIEKNGGTVQLQQLVSKIITQDGQAVGVEYADVRKPEEKKQEHAKVIIANAAMPNVANQLLDREVSAPIRKRIEKLTPGPGLLSLYLGFKKSPKAMGNKHYSTFIVHPEVKNIRALKSNSEDRFEKRSFVFVDYSQIDSGLAPEGKGFGVICSADQLEYWESLSDEAYQIEKERAAQVLIDRLEEQIPGIKEQIEYYEMGTAKTVKRYTLNPHGTVYGFAQTPEQSFMKRPQHRSEIPGLYFASAWVMPGGGFSGAMYSGAMCAGKVLKDLGLRPF